LKVIGWTPPPPPPASLPSVRPVQAANLAQAQAKADFPIVAPAGLPADVISSTISVTPAQVYSKVTHSWHTGSPFVTFAYKRNGGRSFALRAERYDPQTGPPPKYMYSSDDAPGGKIALAKHANFTWRNGDQVMSASEDDGITAAEILAIQQAMQGVTVPERQTGLNDSGTIVKRYVLRAP
jgi:hypothetical protein